MQLRQNAIWHWSQTSSCSGSLSIKIRIDDRSASGQCPQTTQSKYRSHPMSSILATSTEDASR